MSDGQISLKDTTNSKPPSGNGLLQSVFRNSLGLGLFAILTAGLISVTWITTQEKIETQVRAYEAKALTEILPAGTHDNVLVDSKIVLEPSRLLSSQNQREAYIALNDGVVSAVILPVTAPDGYNGRIELLVGINRSGTPVSYTHLRAHET